KTTFSGVFALLLILAAVLACTFKTGGETGDGKKSDAEKSSESSALSDDDAAIMKKVTKKKSSKKPEKTSENADEGDFIAVYSEVDNPKYAEFNRRFKDQKIIDDVTDNLNNVLALPTDVNVTFKDCGKINAWYRSDTKTITFCYEFMEYFHEKALAMGKTEEQANNIMVGATLFFFFHELGHCLIDVYDLPATGREEDSVDQLSTYILMDSEDDYGETSAISGVLMFHAMAEDEQLSVQLFSDEHSLSSQRAYNLACWTYGKDPDKYSFFIEAELLPEARAARCPKEYEKLSSAWQRLTDPWIKK
ncbi:MAG: DUF4344 domain-containing metallopeptidase, partial [Acidobacteriota bacterium]